MLARIDLMQVRSRFKAGLFLPQSTTEKLLIERLAELGVVVERTTYPPGFSLKRRGVSNERMLQAIADLLYACG